MVIETREIYQRDYLPIHFSYRHQIVLLHFYFIFFCMTSHIILQNLSSHESEVADLCWGKKNFFFFLIDPATCVLLLSQTVGFCSHSK